MCAGGYHGYRSLQDEDTTPRLVSTGPLGDLSYALSTSRIAGEPEARHGQTLRGITPQDHTGETVEVLESWLGTEHTVLGTFVDMDLSQSKIEQLLFGHLESIWQAEKIPHVFWQPTFQDPTGALNRQIAQGQYDRQIKTWAESLTRWVFETAGADRRLYLNLAPEFNGDWSPWSPAVGDHSEEDFVDMWRHIYNLVTGEGLGETEIQWIWTLDNTTRGVDRTACYPGERYVDWCGIHGYNWTNWTEWQPPDEVFQETLGFIRELTDNPVAITEFGCSPVQESGAIDVDRKREWISEAYRFIAQEDIRLSLYFDMHAETDWGIFDVKQGSEIIVQDGERFEVFPIYRDMMNQRGMLGPHPEHDRILTDEEFAGQF